MIIGIWLNSRSSPKELEWPSQAIAIAEKSTFHICLSYQPVLSVCLSVCVCASLSLSVRMRIALSVWDKMKIKAWPETSIWFEIGWVVDTGKTNFNFLGTNFRKISISQKNRIFQVNWQRISNFFRQKFSNDLFSHWLQNVRLSRQILPFTAKF